LAENFFACCLVRADLVGLGRATVATHPDGVRAGCLLASNILALVVTAANFRIGNDTAYQSGNGRSDKNCFLSFIHIFVFGLFCIL
jgi:hypothetical protein